MAAPPPYSGYPPPAYYVQRSTPIGVVLLGVLTILLGVGGLVIGIPLLLAAGFLGIVGGILAAGVLAVLALVVTVVGIIAIAAGVGLIRLRTWAWWLAFIVGFLQFVALIFFNVFLAAIWFLILVYLVVVKKHFGPRPVAVVPA